MPAIKKKSGNGKAAAPRRNGRVPPAAVYDQLKEFDGQKYTGMRVGRGHHWRYDAREWIEKKVTPDQWDFQYAVVKQRKGHAPEGSGVPAGTKYHWYILAHQTATKLDANRYSTQMVGVKHKLAHQRADKGGWSASERAQRKRLIQILRTALAELEREQAEAAEAPAAPAAKASPRRPRQARSMAA
jgi:hypothetical protein